MDPHTPPDEWTPADDDFLRSALMTLRDDTDHLPLADPAFLRAQGARRRRRRALAWGAGMAAAVIVVGAVGFGTLGREATAPILPASSSTPPTASPSTSPSASASASPSSSPSTSSTTPSPSRTSTPSVSPTTSPSPSSSAGSPPLDTASPLPIAREWQSRLSLATTPTIEPQPSGDFSAVCGPATLPRNAQLADDVIVVGDTAKPDATLIGTTRRLTFPATMSMREGFVALYTAINACDIPGSSTTAVTPMPETWEGKPLVWTFSGAGMTGYIGLIPAPNRAEITYVEAYVPSTVAPEGGFAQLAEDAAQRLEEYGTTPAN